MLESKDGIGEGGGFGRGDDGLYLTALLFDSQTEGLAEVLSLELVKGIGSVGELAGLTNTIHVVSDTREGVKRKLPAFVAATRRGRRRQVAVWCILMRQEPQG